MKSKKLIIALVLAAVMLLGYITYGVTDGITEDMVKSYTTPENSQNIIKTVLEDTGRSGQFNPASANGLNVYFGNILSTESNDILIDAGFGQNNSLVALYTLEDDIYQYVTEVGLFSEIESIQLFPVTTLGRDIFLITEISNQLLGAFEIDQFLKGYGWFDGRIQQVLNTTVDITAYWYNLWNDPNAEPQWTQIEQKSDLTMEDGFAPAIKLKRHHTVSISSDAELSPEKCLFDVAQNRTVDETYSWDPDWNQFILGEKIEKSTMRPVAILEDYSALPYALVGEDTNQYRILRDNGETAVVPADSLI